MARLPFVVCSIALLLLAMIPRSQTLAVPSGVPQVMYTASSPTSRPLYKFPTSDRIFSEAQKLMPGGVSSPVRAFSSVGGGPVVMSK